MSAHYSTYSDDEPPSLLSADNRFKNSNSDQVQPKTPENVQRTRDSTQDDSIKNKSNSLSRSVVVANSCSFRNLIPENGSRKRSYQLEFSLHKKQKLKGEWHGAKPPKDEENVEERSISEFEKTGGDDQQSSDMQFDLKVIRFSEKKQSTEFDPTEEAESLHSQEVSSAFSPKSRSNTLIQSEIETRIEKKVKAIVDSHLQIIRTENEMMKEKIQEMLRKTDKFKKRYKSFLKHFTHK